MLFAAANNGGNTHQGWKNFHATVALIHVNEISNREAWEEYRKCRIAVDPTQRIDRSFEVRLARPVRPMRADA
jgi:ribosomal 30S subunit maturation factor RimM